VVVSSSPLPLPSSHPPQQQQQPQPPPPPGPGPGSGSGSRSAFFPAAAPSPFRFAAHPQVRRPSLLLSSHRVAFRTERIRGAIAVCRSLSLSSLSRYTSPPSSTDAVVALRMAVNPPILPIDLPFHTFSSL
jgi:hypothetical protein